VKHQYYGDSRDVAKWTTLVRLARMHDLTSIIQVAMLTPDDKTTHGSQRGDPVDADANVRRFFAQERKRFARDPRLRSITGAKRLRELLQPPLAIEVMNDPFRHRNREAYFKDVGARLSRLGRPALVFLDPDKGIAARRATENHVAFNELTQVWEALNPGSVLVVFQFAQRSVGWRENAIDLFGRAVGVSPRLITYFRCPRVVFLSSLKAGGRVQRRFAAAFGAGVIPRTTSLVRASAASWTRRRIPSAAERICSGRSRHRQVYSRI
jgi:hypothetical protein